MKLAVLHDYKGSPEQKLATLVKDKQMTAKSLFHVGQFRDASNPTRSSDIEDLLPIKTSLQYFYATYASQLGGGAISEGDLPPSDRVVQRLENYIKWKGISLRPSGGFNHYRITSRFATPPPAALDSDTIVKFKALFASVNSAF